MTRPCEWAEEAKAHAKKSAENEANAMLKMSHISSLVNKIKGSIDREQSPGTPAVKEAALTPAEVERQEQIVCNQLVRQLEDINGPSFPYALTMIVTLAMLILTFSSSTAKRKKFGHSTFMAL